MTPPFSLVWVFGLGEVGATLVAQLAKAGHRVVGTEVDADALARGREKVRAAVADDSARDRITCTTDPSLLSQADLVVEAVPEALDVKVDVLRTAVARCTPDAVFVATTTGFSVTEIGAKIGALERTVGLQLDVPAAGETIGGTELVSTPVTDQGVRQRVDDLVRSLGCVPLWQNDQPGFTGAGLLLRYLNDAARMYGSGYASCEDIDTAMELGCGLRHGPLRRIDLIGVDNVVRSLTALADRTGDASFAPAPILARMHREGVLGRKSGQGFHSYDRETPPKPAAAPRHPPLRIGVVGAGTMGTGIASVFAQHGHSTTLLGRSGTRVNEARAAIERSLSKRVAAGKLSAEDMAAAVGRLAGAVDYDALADCDLVVEAVSEDIETKRSVFAALDKVVQPEAVLATSTSSLPVLDSALATTRPEQVLGMHFFNPAPAMKLVEVVHTVLTDKAVTAAAGDLVRSLGKVPVHCSDRAGFIVNALLFPYLNRAVTLIQDRQATLDALDDVMTQAYGYPLGPIRLLDVVGLDVSLAIQQRLHESFDSPGLAPAGHLAEFVAAGYFGVKTGRGFRPH
ncbi:3-hydroxyacyl-CoA dehydrogenase family protein [Amycolatopsis silviterrae]|uniref:3-hydroxyacyl-CoA dehydrogenase family protein n=1 Tax=Amycolatopsis silviterrae TaxID=1656914 RepID=A0ABW5H3S7_9PSEU